MIRTLLIGILFLAQNLCSQSDQNAFNEFVQKVRETITTQNKSGAESLFWKEAYSKKQLEVAVSDLLEQSSIESKSIEYEEYDNSASISFPIEPEGVLCFKKETNWLFGITTTSQSKKPIVKVDETYYFIRTKQ